MRSQVFDSVARLIFSFPDRRTLVNSSGEVHNAKMSKRVPTRKEFEQMAARGRLHKEDNTVIPIDSELDEAQSPVDLGPLYGYSEDDIAHFYKFRWRGPETAYTEYMRDLQYAKIPPAEGFSDKHKR
jgi:hypothetical protein